jgi:hypothetical protein
VLPRTYLFNLRHQSLVRGVALSLVAFGLSLRLGGFPDIDTLHSSGWQIVPVMLACWSIGETIRCTERTWSLRYAGVLIMLYSEVMILGLAVVLFFYP